MSSSSPAYYAPPVWFTSENIADVGPVCKHVFYFSLYYLSGVRQPTFFFFLNDPAPTEFSTLPLHDALPILGDGVGGRGRRAVKNIVPRLRTEWALDFVVCNGENSAGGSGITSATAKEIFAGGVDIITSDRKSTV